MQTHSTFPAAAGLALALAVTLGGCGDDDDTAADLPDANPACPDPTAALPENWRPIGTVSEGAVEVEAATMRVDATAGGPPNAAERPYTYLTLFGGDPAKAAISDVDSYSNADGWDIAFKRTVIRINGGDSGPGGVQVAAVPGSTVNDVDSMPAESAFAADDWVTDDCELVSGDIGEPVTAVGTWYDYDLETNLLSPRPQVLVVRRGESAIRLRITDYYDGDESGIYAIDWSPL